MGNWEKSGADAHASPLPTHLATTYWVIVAFDPAGEV
jgi:hypothetical protein